MSEAIAATAAWLLNNLLGIIAVIISIVAVYYTHRQLKEAQQAREDARDAAKAQEVHVKVSAEAAERSASAAEKSAEAASRGVLQGQRAYLTVEVDHVGEARRDEVEIYAEIHVRALGSTPAFNVSIGASVQFHKGNISDVTVGESEGLVFEAYTKSDYPMYAKLPFIYISRDDYDLIGTPHGQLLLSVDLSYDDIFGIRHNCRWCFLLKHGLSRKKTGNYSAHLIESLSNLTN